MRLKLISLCIGHFHFIKDRRFVQALTNKALENLTKLHHRRGSVAIRIAEVQKELRLFSKRPEVLQSRTPEERAAYLVKKEELENKLRALRSESFSLEVQEEREQDELQALHVEELAAEGQVDYATRERQKMLSKMRTWAWLP